MVTSPTFIYETPYWEKGYPVIGADEVGRGAFAGPVVASAVVFPPRLSPTCLLGVHDSKLLTREKRESLVACIHKHAIVSAIAVIDVMTINAKDKQCGIIKGDQKSLTIAAASILAKVYRDTFMREQDKIFPAYGFAKHVGYGTKTHREAIKKNGLSPLHRRSFDLLKYL